MENLPALYRAGPKHRLVRQSPRPPPLPPPRPRRVQALALALPPPSSLSPRSVGGGQVGVGHGGDEQATTATASTSTGNGIGIGTDTTGTTGTVAPAAHSAIAAIAVQERQELEPEEQDIKPDINLLNLNLQLGKPLIRLQRCDEVSVLRVVPTPASAASVIPVIRKSKSKMPALPSKKANAKREVLVEGAGRARLTKLKVGGGTGGDKCKTLSRPTAKTGTSGTGIATGATMGTMTPAKLFRRYTRASVARQALAKARPRRSCAGYSNRPALPLPATATATPAFPASTPKPKKKKPIHKIQPLGRLSRHGIDSSSTQSKGLKRRQPQPHWSRRKSRKLTEDGKGMNQIAALELAPLLKKKSKKLAEAEINLINQTTPSEVAQLAPLKKKKSKKLAETEINLINQNTPLKLALLKKKKKSKSKKLPETEINLINQITPSKLAPLKKKKSKKLAETEINLINQTTPSELAPLKKKKPKKLAKAEINLIKQITPSELAQLKKKKSKKLAKTKINLINQITPSELAPLKKKKSKKLAEAEINPIPSRRRRIPLKKLEDRHPHRRRKLKNPIVASVETSTLNGYGHGHGSRRLSAPVRTLMPPPPEELPESEEVHSAHAIAAAQSASEQSEAPALPVIPVPEARSVQHAPAPRVGDVWGAKLCRGCFPLGTGHGYPVHVCPAGLELPSGIHHTMCKMPVKFLGPAYYLPNQPPWAENIVEMDGKQFWLVPNKPFAVAPVRCNVDTEIVIKEEPEEPPVEIEQQPPEPEPDSTEDCEDDVVQLPVPAPPGLTTTTSSSNNEVRCLKCEMVVPATSMSIVDHTQEHHMRRRQKECPICEKKYSTKLYLLDHIKTHYELPQEVCLQCGAGFASTFRLNRHVKTIHSYRTDSGPSRKISKLSLPSLPSDESDE